MHAIAFNHLLTASRPLTRSACRIIAGTRYPAPRTRRAFHNSSVRWSQSAPEENGNEKENGEVEKGDGEGDGEVMDGKQKVARSGNGVERIGTAGRSRPGRQKQQAGLPPVVLPRGYWERCVLCVEEERTFGRLLRRSTREIQELERARSTKTANARKDGDGKPTEGAAMLVKNNFSSKVEGEGSAEIHNELPRQSSEQSTKNDTGVGESEINADQKETNLKSSEEDLNSATINPTSEGRSIHQDVYDEIDYLLRAALFLRPPKTTTNQSISRPVTVLQCPQDGAHDLLNSTVETIAREANCDLIRLGANDFAEGLGSYVGENIAWQTPRISALGYETARMGGRLEGSSAIHATLPPFQEDIEMMEEDEDALNPGSRNTSPSFSTADLKKRLTPILERIDKLNVWKSAPSDTANTLFTIPLGDSGSKLVSSSSETDHWANLKITAALERFIASADEKASDMAKDHSITDLPQRNLIIQIQDYKEMNATKFGAELITKLRSVIDKKWKEGRNIICVGTTASQQAVTALSQREIRQLQADTDTDTETRSVYVPADQGLAAIDQYDWFEGSRIRDINIRQIEDMVRAMMNGVEPNVLVHLTKDLEFKTRDDTVDLDQRMERTEADLKQLQHFQTNDSIKDADGIETGIDGGTAKYFQREKSRHGHPNANFWAHGRQLDGHGIRESVWTLSRVRRIVTVMLGFVFKSGCTRIGAKELTDALTQLKLSDEAKFSYGKATIAADEDGVKSISDLIRGSNPRARHVDKIAELSKTCTPHEKKMFKGIVSPADIKTTFNDIRAPEDTIEALKTLTGLALLRPEAFSYGVLASDKIPGLLLYGPPGTGKTLLAKAVAKESGATVLEVSGADINDMYVGEGEKNVKAVFSLAKKLSPCIVFIDEADAIFAARGSAGKQRSHREMINQFLREWDGMRDLGTFIMIATNRPFDLDDAVLRRLPRRLLVDLPVERDREAILNIHLKDEVLEADVSLAQIAKDTSFYSGSDLKNVCVAAALACIREENAEAAKWTGEGAYEYPEKRTLKSSHFKKALDEISASVSEDMSTLGQIRKFDERYGDRKGRRKRKPQMGFGVGKEVEKDSDAVRVRNLEV